MTHTDADQAPIPVRPEPAAAGEQDGTTTDVTFDEMLDTVTGYEELAVKAVSDGVPLHKLMTEDPILSTRCLIAVYRMREAVGEDPGPKTYRPHYRAALELTMHDVRTFFARPSNDPIPDEPDSESGKDGSRSGETTMT